MTIKHERLQGVIRKEISDIIQFDVKDPSLGFVTITDVELTNDNSYATIYVTFLGKDTRNDAGLKVLNRAKGYMRKELAKRIKIRKVPELIFKLDNTLNESLKIQGLLDKIKNK